MRTITFNEAFGERGKQLDIYVEGQLAAISVDTEMQDVIHDLTHRCHTNGDRHIAKLLMKDITEEFELSKEEQYQFIDKIEEKLREGKI